MTPILIGSARLAQSDYGAGHPLSIPRAMAAVELIKHMGWLTPAQYREAPLASEAQLSALHTPAYVQALWRAQAAQITTKADRQNYNFGTPEHPLRADIFDRAALAAGGSLLAVQLLQNGGAVFNIIGGAHHAKAAQASGFCYFNDAALALQAFLAQGCARVAYVDLDAHHGDGVEELLQHDKRVRLFSIHEQQIVQRSGFLQHRGVHNNVRNLPVPTAINDSEFALLIEQVILPQLAEFKPEALVIQCGADLLAGDNLARGQLSNNALWQAVSKLSATSPRLLLLGGGGYNADNVLRAWAGLWGVLNGHNVNAPLPPAAQKFLQDTVGGVRPRLSLADRPNQGAVRPVFYDLRKASFQP